MNQNTQSVLMIRPCRFQFNMETAPDNAFQLANEGAENVQERALEEFDLVAEKLNSLGIETLIFDDTPKPHTPDSIFPNNWISMHQDGTLILYPMYAQNRRNEVRNDIVDLLNQKFEVNRFLNLTEKVNESVFLEGTGSMIFDNLNEVVYASASKRTDKQLFIEIANKIGFKPIYFHAFDKNKKEIYHTNVLLSIGEKYALICLEALPEYEQQKVLKQLSLGRKVIIITFQQMLCFAGNILELKSAKGSNITLISKTAYQSLGIEQIQILSSLTNLEIFEIPTIEAYGGGGIRCMIAEIFLKPRLK